MKMMKNFLWGMTLVVATAATLAACSSDDAGMAASLTDDQQPGDGQRLEISVSSSVGEPTRSNTAENLLSGDTVWVWTDMVNPSTTPATVTEYFKAWALKANGLGGLSTLASGNTKLFPATNPLNFYALVGNFGLVTEGDRKGKPTIDAENDELPTTAGIRHTVLKDQTTAEAYYKSDLLYAVRPEQEPISTAVPLQFRHMLSRIQVVLVAGNGMTTADLSEATVELLSLRRQIAMTPDKAKDPAVQADREAMLTWSNLFQSGDIKIATTVVASNGDATAAGSTLYADAIVVPQPLAEGTEFIKVSYLGRDTYYRIPTGGLTLESGKQYRFRLTADRIGSSYEMTITIADWDSLAGTAMWAE